MLQLFYTYI